MADVPLDGEAIRRYLAEVAAELGTNGPVHEVVMVGGSVMAVYGLRLTTLDVDSVVRFDQALAASIAIVGRRHGLDQQWLNARAATFRPATFERAECSVLMTFPRLRVLAPPLALVFVMKLYASRARDYDDLVVLWPRTGFASPAAAKRAFDEAYPHLDPDPYLEDHIARIAARAAPPGTQNARPEDG